MKTPNLNIAAYMSATQFVSKHANLFSAADDGAYEDLRQDVDEFHVCFEGWIPCRALHPRGDLNQSRVDGYFVPQGLFVACVDASVHTELERAVLGIRKLVLGDIMCMKVICGKIDED